MTFCQRSSTRELDSEASESLPAAWTSEAQVHYPTRTQCGGVRGSVGARSGQNQVDHLFSVVVGCNVERGPDVEAIRGDGLHRCIQVFNVYSEVRKCILAQELIFYVPEGTWQIAQEIRNTLLYISLPQYLITKGLCFVIVQPPNLERKQQVMVNKCHFHAQLAQGQSTRLLA